MNGKPPVGVQAQPTRSVIQTPAPKPPALEKTRAGSRFRGLRFSPAAGVIGSVAADAQRSRLPQMAAALAYRTIFGMIPVMVVALVGLKFFTSEEDIQRTLSRALTYAGLSEIVIDPADTEVPPEALKQTWLIPFGPSPVPKLLIPMSAEELALEAAEEQREQAAAAAAAEDADADANENEGDESKASADEPAKGQGAPGTMTVETTGSERLDDWITQLVGRVAAIPFRTIGVIGLIALLYAAISMLVEIERSFNQIYRVPTGRSWPRRITNYWSLLTLGVLMLFATFYVGEQFKDWAASVAESRGLVQSRAPLTSEGLTAEAASRFTLVGVLGFVTTVFISTAFLLLAYTTVPNTRVRIRPALAGAFLAALMWETGKWGFTQYIGYSAGYARMYGSMAILPLFLLWVYVTWVIVLLGLQISYYLQYEQYKKVPVPVVAEAPRPPAILDPAASIAVVAAVARAFDEGRAVTAAAAGRAVRSGEEAARAILERLAARNIVHAVEKDPAHPGAAEAFTLSRPAGAISMAEVLDAGYELVAPAAEGAGDSTPAADPIIDRLRKAQVAEVRGMTVGELVGHPPARTSAPGKPAEAGGGGGNGVGNGGGSGGGAGFSKPGAPATLPPAG